MEARTHCPACSNKLPERSREMSNCLYCNFPFEFSEKNGEQQESPFKKRITKVTEHPDFEAAVAWEPEASWDYHQGRLTRNRGLSSLIVASVGLAVGVLSGGILLGILGTVFGLLALWSLWQILRGSARMKGETRWPLMRRACAITDRRSVTIPNGLSGRTTYHFTIEFEDGIQGEFGWPGRGTAIEPLSTGITGVAYTRGSQLVSFKQIRT